MNDLNEGARSSAPSGGEAGAGIWGNESEIVPLRSSEEGEREERLRLIAARRQPALRVWMVPAALLAAVALMAVAVVSASGGGEGTSGAAAERSRIPHSGQIAIQRPASPVRPRRESPAPSTRRRHRREGRSVHPEADPAQTQQAGEVDRPTAQPVEAAPRAAPAPTTAPAPTSAPPAATAPSSTTAPSEPATCQLSIECSGG